MSDTTLSADDQRALRCLAGMIIPASAKYKIPGADDETIFADIISSFDRDAAAIADAMAHLRQLSGGCFADLPAEKRQPVAAAFKEAGGTPLRLTVRVIMECYYRDDRVMRSIGMEVRPPFPKGHELEQGDWSLLDPVRQRPILYRPTP